jgi:uncharacterized delta-60 repeat protein
MSILSLKNGISSISGATVKGDFNYFSGGTRALGPSEVTGFFSGFDAPNNGYSVYKTYGESGFTITIATNTSELNYILIKMGGTGSTVDQNITWVTNTNSVFINSGTTTAALLSYYFGGFFTEVSGTSQNRLTKLNSDGSKDTSFDIGSGFNATVWSTSIQSDGKILVGGNFTTFTGETNNRLIRLNSDGSKDTSFNIGSGFDNVVETVDIQSDGKVLVGGRFTTFSGASQNSLIRLNSDGSKDTSFNIGSGFSSPLDTELYSVVVQSDGKILVGGYFTTFSGASQNSLIRLNSDGSKDTSFNIGSGIDFYIKSIAVQSDGKILVGGYFTTFSGASQNSLIRLNSDGSKDTSFNIGDGFDYIVETVVIQSDGKVLVGGDFETFTGTTQNRLIRLNSDGSKDTSFNIGSGFNTVVYSVAVQSDGKVLVGGSFSTYQGVTSLRSILLNSDGSISNNIFDFDTGVLSIQINQ